MNQLCNSDSDCGGGTCGRNNKGAACQEGSQCTGGAECLLSCPSHFQITDLRTERPVEVKVKTAGEVDGLFLPCTISPQTCDVAVMTGEAAVTALPLAEPLPVTDLHVSSMTESSVNLMWSFQGLSHGGVPASYLILRGRRNLGASAPAHLFRMHSKTSLIKVVL